MPEEFEQPSEKAGIGSGYPAFQLARALTAHATHEDSAARERALEKVKKWQAVLQGMWSGLFSIGSRRPTDAPVWATLEVITGGFATGKLLANGPLQPHEKEQLEKLKVDSPQADRGLLNAYALSDAGFAELGERLNSGHYQINVPEEGAFLVAAWLAAQGQVGAANSLLETLSAQFPELRFYPVPTARPLEQAQRARVQSEDAARESLARVQPSRQARAQRETIATWLPIYDRAIELFLETVTGELPFIQPDAEGRWVSPETGKFAVQGGWPCQQYPEDWAQRARALDAEYQREQAHHRVSQRAVRADESFVRLLGFLRRCAEKPASLNGRDVGMIRLVLARHLTKCGQPSSEKLRLLRERQARQIATPDPRQIARIVLERLDQHSLDGGQENLRALLSPITTTEATAFHVPEGAPILRSLAQKVTRSVLETPQVLIQLGVISSSEILATVLPQLTGHWSAEAFRDPALRRLYAAIYQAFRKRRSLLLVNLESQVRLEELPWIAVLKPFREPNSGDRHFALQALKEVTLLALRSFPHTILPNKLVKELSALSTLAGLQLPLVNEIAADIFMGAFTHKFALAAQHAADLLEGSLYQRYFAIRYDSIRALRVPDSADPAKPVANQAFFELCQTRAGNPTGYGVAKNGLVIEQAQILTTHNLASLFLELDLSAPLREDLERMSRDCFVWICQRQQKPPENYHARLVLLKNTAYAWRQMIFFLSLLPVDRVTAFLAWAGEHLNQQTATFADRFRPALRGLISAHSGRSLDVPENGRRFLGWTTEEHWLFR